MCRFRSSAIGDSIDMVLLLYTILSVRVTFFREEIGGSVLVRNHRDAKQALAI
jgi:hypothetical protein